MSSIPFVPRSPSIEEQVSSIAPSPFTTTSEGYYQVKEQIQQDRYLSATGLLGLSVFFGWLCLASWGLVPGNPWFVFIVFLVIFYALIGLLLLIRTWLRGSQEITETIDMIMEIMGYRINSENRIQPNWAIDSQSDSYSSLFFQGLLGFVLICFLFFLLFSLIDVDSFAMLVVRFGVLTLFCVFVWKAIRRLTILLGDPQREFWEQCGYVFYSGKLFFTHYPLKRKDDYSATFRCKLENSVWRHFLKINAFPAVRGEVQLLCVERVEYLKGTDTCYDKAVVYQSTIHNQRLMAGSQEIIYNFDVSIPDNLPPSFEARHNQIRWILLVKNVSPQFKKPVYWAFTLKIEP